MDLEIKSFNSFSFWTADEYKNIRLLTACKTVVAYIKYFCFIEKIRHGYTFAQLHSTFAAYRHEVNESVVVSNFVKNAKTFKSSHYCQQTLLIWTESLAITIGAISACTTLMYVCNRHSFDEKHIKQYIVKN